MKVIILKKTLSKKKKMINRYKEYENIVKHKRKLFTEVQKRKIACRQQYRCMGSECRKYDKLLPEVWDLDHSIPLFKGGTNHYNFDTLDDSLNNLVILCSNCHAMKTQQEKIDFYREEREHKFIDKEFIVAKEFYKNEDDEISQPQVKKFCFDDFKYHAKKI